MIDSLRDAGAEVFECHETLWLGIEDRVSAASGQWLRFSFFGRVLRTYFRLLLKYRSVPDYDVLVVGYPGQIDAFLARVLAWLRGRPLVMDMFMSIYLVACERGLVEKHPLTGRLIYAVEKLACHLPDMLIAMTNTYVDWFEEVFGLDPARFRVVFTGADDCIYRPVEGEPDPDWFTVLYYGTFIHTHGVLSVVEAARLLKDHSRIRFVMIGQGPLKQEAMERVARYRLDNVEMVDWVDKEQIPYRVAESDICLGVFGTTPQVEITIQNKIYEGLAMAKPVLTADAPTVRRWLHHGEHVYLCEKNNPQALAAAILELRANPQLRARIARQGRALFLGKFAPAVLGRSYRQHLETLIPRRCDD